ncbi:MAG: HypC/HybG/HupF family hydrogenase formation chaperone [candidate division Zixibacteria bacterium]|nr:HypC/HybG/HupF family hydrogenase formation chaperone [candidate division Zixibacteria bacterium]
MCLGVPMKIIEVEGTTATVEMAQVRQECDLSLAPEARVGDYVIVHAGFAIEVLDEEEAQETLELLDAMGLDTGRAP